MKRDEILEFLRQCSFDVSLEWQSNEVWIYIVENVGSANLFAKGPDDLWWLNQNSYYKTRESGRVLYKVKFNG